MYAFIFLHIYRLCIRDAYNYTLNGWARALCTDTRDFATGDLYREEKN